MRKEQMIVERRMKHSYLTIVDMEPEFTHYETKMLLRSQIPGVLPCQVMEEDGKIKLQYEITRVQVLAAYLEHRCICAAEIEALLLGVDQLLEQMEAHLLSEQLLYLSPESVFINVEDGRFYFIAVPGYAGDFREALRGLLAYVLKKIDYADRDAVVLAYTLFQESSKEVYGMEELLRIVRQGRRQSRRREQVAGCQQDGAEQIDQTVGVAQPARTMGQGIQGRELESMGQELRFCGGNARREKETVEQRDVQPGARGQLQQNDCTDLQKEAWKRAEKQAGGEDFMGFGLLDATEEGKDTGYAEDGLLYNAADDRKHAALYEQDEEDPWVVEEREENRQKGRKKQQMDQERRQIKWKLILAIVLMLLIPSGIWFIKGDAMFIRMLPIIIIVEVGVAVVTALDYLATD